MNLESTALKYIDGELIILDQTLLPFREEWIRVSDVEHLFEIIKSLKVRGAPLIGVSAALGLAQYASKQTDAKEFIDKAEFIKTSRPTAVNLMFAVDRLIQIAKDDYSFKSIENEAIHLFQEDVNLCDNIGHHGMTIINDHDHILTHCNSGGLATVGIGTALGVIIRAHQNYKGIHVYVDETRPLLQGGRLTTWELEKNGVPYNLICDNMAATTMQNRKVDKVIVGADRIALNGDFANKIGTYNLAVLCKYHNIDFYVAAPYTTIDFDCASGDNIPIENRDPFELKGFRNHHDSLQWAKSEGEKGYNPAFDVTPAELVTGWILDSGLYDQDGFKTMTASKI